MKQIGNILVSVPSTVVAVPEPVDYRDKRIDVMEWMTAHGNSAAYDWLKLHEPEIAAIFDEPEVVEGAEYRERSTY